MDVRNFSPSDYETICSWWKAAGEVAPPLKHMPCETTFLVSADSVPVASLGYFTTNTDVALVQNVVGNPGVDKALKHLCVNYLFNYLDNHANNNGFKILLGFTKHPKLAKRYQELGWTPSAMIFVGKEI